MVSISKFSQFQMSKHDQSYIPILSNLTKTINVDIFQWVSQVFCTISRSMGGHFLWTFSRLLTWCRAVSPSMLAVSISAPRFNSLSTSSLSEAAHAAKKTQPSVNWILWDFRLGSEGSWFVSLSCHLFNCSALLNKAEELRFSREVMVSVKVGLTELHSYYSLG